MHPGGSLYIYIYTCILSLGNVGNQGQCEMFLFDNHKINKFVSIDFVLIFGALSSVHNRIFRGRENGVTGGTRIFREYTTKLTGGRGGTK